MFIVQFPCSFGVVRFRLLWLLLCTILSIFMYSRRAIVIKDEVLNQTLPYCLYLVIISCYIGALSCVVLLTSFTVFNKMTFPAAFYICAIFELLLLLWSPLKYLLLLRSLVWLLLLNSLSLKSLILILL